MKREQKQIYVGEPKYLKRLIITAAAIGAMMAVVIIPAKMLGEFSWYLGY